MSFLDELDRIDVKDDDKFWEAVNGKLAELADALEDNAAVCRDAIDREDWRSLYHRSIDVRAAGQRMRDLADYLIDAGRST